MSVEPEFRRDPVCGRWAIIAPERSHRPRTLEGTEPRHRRNRERKPCPFCPGQERDTPDEVLAYRPASSLPNGPGWQLRVVPNKFPAVSPDILSEYSSADTEIFLLTPGLGRAEVVIECPEHLPDPRQLTDSQLSDVLRAYRDRIIALSGERDLVYASVFKNVGADAGASLGHTHSQIIAIPFIPPSIETELSGAATYFSRTQECVFCEIIRQECMDRHRLIAQSENYLAITAFAPRFDGEFWILPRKHFSHYETISETECVELAQLTKKVLLALDVVLEEHAYNWFLHTAPLRSAELPHFHWHLEMMPRTSRAAGLEWGFGCFITALSPEKLAADFRMAIAAAEH